MGHMGYITNTTLTGATTPNKKVSDVALKYVMDHTNKRVDADYLLPMNRTPALVHEIYTTAAETTFKYWIYNDTGETLNDTNAVEDIFLVAEYVSAYDDTSEYVIDRVYSTQIDILNAADATDWDYLEVTLTPAVASTVRLYIMVNKYDPSLYVYIDPAVVIS
jgi:hypothetical protein